MTFCLGMKLKDGLVGIADTRVTTGSECITAQKLTHYQNEGHAFFIMTSGLRSVRDKTLTYFDEAYAEAVMPWERLFHICNEFAARLRRVAQEDRKHLEDNGLHFNTHAIIGGQMEKDDEPRLYLVYPEGNWVEIASGTPYAIIGNSGYGKPVLDRALHYTDPIRYAFKIGCLSFDSTRISAADVDFPIDTVLMPRDVRKIISHRFVKEDFAQISRWWDERLRNSLRELPFESLDSFFEELDRPEHKIVSISSGSKRSTRRK